jgi:hypothetical protein
MVRDSKYVDLLHGFIRDSTVHILFLMTNPRCPAAGGEVGVGE